MTPFEFDRGMNADPLEHVIHGWVIINDEFVNVFTFSYKRTDSISKMRSIYPGKTWGQLKRKYGFQCVRSEQRTIAY